MAKNKFIRVPLDIKPPPPPPPPPPPEECPPACCDSTGEIVFNPGFEGDFSLAGVPEGWEGINVEEETEQEQIHSGEKAVVVGANPAQDASLRQVITDPARFLPGCQYHFSFFAGGSLAAAATFTGSIIFRDDEGDEIGRSDVTIISASIEAGVGEYYYVVSDTAPANLASLEVSFVKVGVGQVSLDDVSLSIA